LTSETIGLDDLDIFDDPVFHHLSYFQWLAVILSILVLSEAFYIPPSGAKSNGVVHMSKPQQLHSTKGLDLDLCPTCVDFTGQAINNLLNIILSKYKQLSFELFLPKHNDKVPF
jgi:hypothetical protein